MWDGFTLFVYREDVVVLVIVGVLPIFNGVDVLAWLDLRWSVGCCCWSSCSTLYSFGVLGLGNHGYGHGHGTRVAVGELRLGISCPIVQLSRTGDTRRRTLDSWVVLLRVGTVRRSGHIRL